MSAGFAGNKNTGPTFKLGGKDVDIMDILAPSQLSEYFTGEEDESIPAPPVQKSQALPIESTDVGDAAKKRAVRRGGRRKTILTQDNQLGAGDVQKKRVLG